MKPTSNKTADELASEWDAIAPTRDAQISSGRDISYNSVLKPLILRLVEPADSKSVLDLGCGTGQLTASLAQQATHVTGIDISAASICIAAQNTENCGNVTLARTSLDEFARSVDTSFTVVVANMSLSAIPNLNDVVRKLTKLIVPNGHIVATVPHPCFWPQYWEYVKADWFNYWSELSIEAEFRISLESSGMMTTHLHRPLATYINAFSECGFQLEALEEPLPAEVPGCRDGHHSRYPRFLGWRSRLFKPSSAQRAPQ